MKQLLSLSSPCVNSCTTETALLLLRVPCSWVPAWWGMGRNVEHHFRRQPKKSLCSILLLYLLLVGKEIVTTHCLDCNLMMGTHKEDGF